MLFGNKKEWSTDTHYSLEEPWKIYAKWKPEYAKDHVLYDSLYMKWPERSHRYSHTEAIPRFPSRLLESSVWWVCPSVPLSYSQMFNLQFRLLSQGGTNIPPLPDFCVSQWLSPVWPHGLQHAEMEQTRTWGELTSGHSALVRNVTPGGRQDLPGRWSP